MLSRWQTGGGGVRVSGDWPTMGALVMGVGAGGGINVDIVYLKLNYQSLCKLKIKESWI